MTTPPPESPESPKAPDVPPQPAPPQRTSITPTPAALIAALMTAGVLVYNMSIDGDRYLSLALVIVFGAVLGVDLSRLMRRGGDE